MTSEDKLERTLLDDRVEKSIKRLRPLDTSDSEDSPSKKRRCASQIEVEKDGDSSDAGGLLRSNEPDANLANEGKASEAHVRLEQDALLTEISQDPEQEEEVGNDINQQLAEIINKRQSTKVLEAKRKKWTNTHVQEIVRNLLFLALTLKYGTSLITRLSTMICVLQPPEKYCLKLVL